MDVKLKEHLNFVVGRARETGYLVDVHEALNKLREVAKTFKAEDIEEMYDLLAMLEEMEVMEEELLAKQ